MDVVEFGFVVAVVVLFSLILPESYFFSFLSLDPEAVKSNYDIMALSFNW